MVCYVIVASQAVTRAARFNSRDARVCAAPASLPDVEGASGNATCGTYVATTSSGLGKRLNIRAYAGFNIGTTRMCVMSGHLIPDSY